MNTPSKGLCRLSGVKVMNYDDDSDGNDDIFVVNEKRLFLSCVTCCCVT